MFVTYMDDGRSKIKQGYYCRARILTAIRVVKYYYRVLGRTFTNNTETYKSI